MEFTLDITAAREDVDDLGHISNLVFLRWVLEAARAHSRGAGWDFAAYQRLGAVFVVRKHEIEYLVPAYAGDALRLTTWVDSWQGASCERRTRVTRVADGVELARATTMWVLVSAQGGRPRRIPPEIRAAFSGPRDPAAGAPPAPAP